MFFRTKFGELGEVGLVVNGLVVGVVGDASGIQSGAVETRLAKTGAGNTGVSLVRRSKVAYKPPSDLMIGASLSKEVDPMTETLVLLVCDILEVGVSQVSPSSASNLYHLSSVKIQPLTSLHPPSQTPSQVKK